MIYTVNMLKISDLIFLTVKLWADGCLDEGGKALAH